MKYDTYFSKNTGKEYAYYIIFPEGYEDNADFFPVIYGFYPFANESEAKCEVLDFLKAPDYSELYASGFMILMDSGSFMDSSDEKMFPEEFVPYIDGTYRTIASRRGRGLEGYREGGGLALRLALEYPSTAASAISYGGVRLPDKSGGWTTGNLEDIRGKLRIRIVTGDEATDEENAGFNNILDGLGITHQFIRLKNPVRNLRDCYEAMGMEGLRFHNEAFYFFASENIAVPEPGTRLVSNLVYGWYEGRPKLLDLYLPEDRHEPLPVIFWIHGGGWMVHSKEYYVPVHMVQRGYAIASIDYRLSHQAKFPAQIVDCKEAVRWLKANAEKYGLEARRTGAWGNSAGGHLAALLGTTGKIQKFDLGENLEYTSEVNAVCDYYGPVDLLKMNEFREKQGRKATAETLLLGAPADQAPDFAAAASPITYIDENTAPFLIVHGDKDEVVHHSQSILLYDALRAAGIEAELHILEGAVHGFELGDMDVTHINNLVAAFFDKHLKRH